MKFKSAICIFLSIIILSCSAGISFAAFAAVDASEVSSTTQSNVNDFYIEGGVLFKYNGKSVNVTIPSSVTRIRWSAFTECPDVIRIVIPACVTVIDSSAFPCFKWRNEIIIDSGNKNYTCEDGVLFNKGKTKLIMCLANKSGEYSIPKTVTSIVDFAFSGCKKLSNIKIPRSVTSIGGGAFNTTPWLENYPSDFVVAGNGILICYKGSEANVKIPGYIKSIGALAFSKSFSLESVVIPKSVKSIGRGAFRISEYIEEEGEFYFENLVNITIPDSVTDIAGSAFEGTPWLNNYPDDFVVVGDHILIDYKGKESKVTIPSDVKSIADGAFSGCNSITDVTIPNGVKTISNYMFYCCYQLQHVSIPNSVTVIGNSAFESCYKLKSVDIPSGVIIIGNTAFKSCAIESINIPSGITAIKKNTFDCCTSLKSVIIPNSVKTIGTNAFSFCKNLISVTIPGSVTNIGSHGFSSCWKLANVTIENGVKSIGYSAFESCWILATITLPNSIDSIDKFAFINGTSLNNIIVDSGNQNFSSLDGVLYNKGKTSLILCPVKKSGKLVIPKTVTTIEDYSFYLCKNLKNIKIPKSVTNIGNNAFSQSGWLENYHGKFIVINNILIDYNSFDKIVSIPRRAKIIWKGAFDSFDILTIVKIPNSVTKIEDFAFYNSKVENVIIPGSVTSIGKDALTSENNIIKIYCPAGSFAETYAKRNNLPYSNDLSVAERMLYPRDKIIIIGLLSLLTAVIFIGAIVLIKKHKKKLKRKKLYETDRTDVFL